MAYEGSEPSRNSVEVETLEDPTLTQIYLHNLRIEALSNGPENIERVLEIAEEYLRREK